MTTKLNTKRYSNTPLITYNKEKAKALSLGWQVLDEAIQIKEKYLNGMFMGEFVTGSITYERKNKTTDK